MIATLEGQVMRAEKNDAAALAFYRTAVQNFPQHRALIYDYTDLLLQNNQAETAVKLLTEQVTRHPSDTTLYDLQARAYAMQGKALEQHQAQAYSYAWQGNLYAAMEQLEIGETGRRQLLPALLDRERSARIARDAGCGQQTLVAVRSSTDLRCNPRYLFPSIRHVRTHFQLGF